MAHELPGFKYGGLIAPSTAFGNRQYYGVNASSSEPFIKIAVGNASSSGPPLGILQNAPQVVGEAAEVMVTGVSKAFCVKAVRAGSAFIFSTSGAIASATGGGALSIHYGPVLQAASSGELATVVLNAIGVTT